jgi:hypothetical protein
VNSGIPNKAFYLAAVNIGGRAWEAPGHIWYESLKASNSTTEFQQFAETTVAKAAQLYGADHEQAVADAWLQVGIRAASLRPAVTAMAAGGDGSLEALQGQLENLAADVRLLINEVRSDRQGTPKAVTGSRANSRQKVKTG